MGRIATALEDERILGFVLLTPALILILVFIAYPFALGIWMSLTDKLVGSPGKFVGLGNYSKLLESDIFRTAAWNTVFFTFMATVFKAALGMWLAVLLNRKFRLARFTRSAVLLPFIVPTVLSTLGLAVDVRCHLQRLQLVAALVVADGDQPLRHRAQGELGLFQRAPVARRSRLGDVLGDPGQRLARSAVLRDLVSRRPADHSAGTVRRRRHRRRFRLAQVLARDPADDQAGGDRGGRVLDRGHLRGFPAGLRPHPRRPEQRNASVWRRSPISSA